MFYKESRILYFVDDSNSKHEICSTDDTYLESFRDGVVYTDTISSAGRGDVEYG